MPGQGIYDRTEKISLNLARLKRGGENFEIVVDADLAIEHKEGKGVAIQDILKTEHIYIDAHRDMLAKEADLVKAFGTDEVLKVAEAIIKDGEIQLTAEHRRKVTEQKRKRIIDVIHRNGVDPYTHAPVPVTRIENAMEEARVRIDEFKKADEQVPIVLAKLRPIIAIKFEINELSIHIPAAEAVKVYSTVKSGATIMREEWQKDGSWLAEVEIAAGLREDFLAKLNKVTKGSVETKILKTR